MWPDSGFAHLVVLIWLEELWPQSEEMLRSPDGQRVSTEHSQMEDGWDKANPKWRWKWEEKKADRNLKEKGERKKRRVEKKCTFHSVEHFSLSCKLEKNSFSRYHSVQMECTLLWENPPKCLCCKILPQKQITATTICAHTVWGPGGSMQACFLLSSLWNKTII